MEDLLVAETDGGMRSKPLQLYFCIYIHEQWLMIKLLTNAGLLNLDVLLSLMQRQGILRSALRYVSLYGCPLSTCAIHKGQHDELSLHQVCPLGPVSCPPKEAPRSEDCLILNVFTPLTVYVSNRLLQSCYLSLHDSMTVLLFVLGKYQTSCPGIYSWWSIPFWLFCI